MWYPVKIILENFRSFVYQEYEFQRGSYLIQGINKTETDEAESNGSGKSSFRESICYSLGLPTFTSTITDLINKDAEKCTVTFELYNSISKQKLKIIRNTPLKGSSTVNVFLNDEDQKDKFATVGDADKFIIDLIGISKEDLLNHYIISKERFTSFFSSSDTKVKELISRFSNFNRIDGVEDIVKKDVDELNTELESLKSSFDKLQGKIDLLHEDLLKEKEINPNELKNKRILELKEEIGISTQKIDKLHQNAQNASKNIDEYNKTKSDLSIQLKTLEKEMESLDKISFDDEIQEIKNKKSDVLESINVLEKENDGINKNVKEFKNFKLEVETAIDGAIKCPKCLHEFIPNDEIDIEEAKKTILPSILEELETFDGKISENNKKLSEIETTVNKYNEQLKGYQSKIDEFNNHKSELSSKIFSVKREIQTTEENIRTENQNIESCEKNIKIIQFDIEGYENKIEEIEKKEVETREKEIKESIEAIEKEKIDIDSLIEQEKDKIFEKEQWIYRFKKFKSSLANESLNIIQGYANMYLKKMQSNLSIQFEGFKQNKNGEIREKISSTILRNGIQEGSGNYKRFSGGERGKVDLATSVLAIQNLINNSCVTGGLDLIYTDEVTESIDGKGLENIVESISQLDKYCYITSHVKHEKVHNNILTIEKVKGISKIV